MLGDTEQRPAVFANAYPCRIHSNSGYDKGYDKDTEGYMSVSIQHATLASKSPWSLDLSVAALAACVKVWSAEGGRSHADKILLPPFRQRLDMTSILACGT